MISLQNTISLVTGSSRGIGRETALRLAEAGSDVCITYLNSARNARELAEQVAGLGRRAIVVKVDFSEEEDIAELIRIVREEFGRLDILVSNAAGGGFRPLSETRRQQFDYCMRINVQALMFLAQHAAPLLEESTLERAKLITLSSLGATRVMKDYGLIGVAKGALESMTRHLAYELGPRGINVNCVCGGMVETGTLASMADKEAKLASRRALSLIGNRDLAPRDLADTVLCLASPLMDGVQGQVITVDAGVSINLG
jgi:enoyl-[acyl-carrier protein] reductase III